MLSSVGMTQFPRSTIAAIGVGLAGAAFVGYCLYFDRKRRSDPNFRQRLREKRRRQRQAQRETRRGAAPAGGMGAMPDMNNPTEMQAFFLQEVQLGEELMGEGDMEGGVEHLCNAVTLCGQPQGLLQILQQTLPAPAFALLMERLPQAGARLAHMAARAGGAGDAGPDSGPTVELIPDPDLE